METMRITLGNKEDASLKIGMTCTNDRCSNVLWVEIDSKSGYTSEDAYKVAEDIGWKRRMFDKNANCHFCCHDCAYNSKRSKELMDIWIGKEKYVSNNPWFGRKKKEIDNVFKKYWKLFLKSLDWFVDHVIP